MIEFVKCETISDWKKVKHLYKNAFPKEERKPLWLVEMKQRTGETDVWMIEEDGEFSGLAITVNEFDMILLDYFAVSEEKRCNGLGGKALQGLQKMYAGKRFFLEIECQDEQAENAAERVRRKAFYLRNGMSEIGVKVSLFKVDMELLGYNCKLTYDEYYSLYHICYGKRIENMIYEIIK